MLVGRSMVVRERRRGSRLGGLIPLLGGGGRLGIGHLGVSRGVAAFRLSWRGAEAAQASPTGGAKGFDFQGGEIPAPFKPVATVWDRSGNSGR